jgi:hypothetical protein
LKPLQHAESYGCIWPHVDNKERNVSHKCHSSVGLTTRSTPLQLSEAVADCRVAETLVSRSHMTRSQREDK